MPGFVREHLRPLAGAAGLHILLFAVIAATAWRWSSSRPPVPMAIEGVVVDARSLPPDAASARPEPAPSAPAPDPVQPRPAVPAQVPTDDAAERAREREAEAQAERERAKQQKLAAEEAARKSAQVEAERLKAAEAARRKAAGDAQRKEADEQRTREAELQRRLAAEEEAAALAASGVVDQYRAELEQAIERSWIRPPSAQAGLVCTLYVTQAPGGTVLDVRLGACNGDAAVKESITNAVFRASPLPAPADPRAFERRLEIVFRPTE